jgi:predicted nucleic acid-binding Zn ribbon protein
MVALPNHSHCKYCGDPIPFGNEYCDDDCRELYLAEKSVERKKDIIFYGLIAASLIVILVIGMVIGIQR